jgi:uncharacterized membrane protein
MSPSKSATPPNDTPAARNVQEIARLERDTAGEPTTGERISLAVTDAVGTFGCVLLHIAALSLWMGWNTLAPDRWRFDPFPFGLMTMFVSMEGVLLAILILTTQNRMSLQSDRRDRLDLQVDLLAEQEMTMMLRMLSRISDRLGVAADDSERHQTLQLMEETNVYELMEEGDRSEEKKSE